MGTLIHGIIMGFGAGATVGYLACRFTEPEDRKTVRKALLWGYAAVSAGVAAAALAW